MKTIITLALALTVSTVIAQTNTEAQRTAGNPIGGIIVKGGHNGLAAKETNPLYTADGNASVNPMAKVTGGPVGGIIVKGGRTDVANAGVTPQSPIYSSNGLEVTSALYQGGGNARVAGTPIGGIIVKGGSNGVAASEVKSTSPLHEASPATGNNPLFENKAMMAGSPIGGIVVKGGQNPTRFEISNPIPSIGVVVKHNIADRAINYTADEPLNDAALLNYLGVTQVVVKKGLYPIDANGRVTLQIEKIVHRDIAARTLQLQGYDAATQTSFDYTVEPVVVNGEISQIIITYKSISEKGVK